MKRAWPVFLVLLLSPHAFSATTAADLLKEAELQETTARRLDVAAKLYAEFLQKSGTDRASQAKAYVHLGICQYKLGQTADAKTTWKKVVQDYSDQSDSYAEALNQLQKSQVAERIVEVRTSTTVVIQRVYEEPLARWMVEFPRGTFLHTIDGKGRLIQTAAGGSLGFVRFLPAGGAVGLEAGNLGASGPPSARRDIGYFITMARLEKPLASPVTGYLKSGAGLYLFNFSNDRKSQTKLTLGGTVEAGLTIGMPRGFAFSFGYLVHTFLQTTPNQDFRDTIPAADIPQASEVLQNRGLRFVGGPDVSLSIRW